MTESQIFKGEKAPLLFGHRGCPQLAPENSLTSFSKILEHNVPGVELDVQICNSGELIVFHDSNLKKKTGFDGNIKDLDYSQIHSISYGPLISDSFTNEKIPLFEEVLQMLGDKVYYDIELKADSLKNRGLEKKVFQMIKDFNIEHRVLISSFNPVTLMRFGKLTTTIPLSLIYTNKSESPYYLRHGEGRFFKKMPLIKPDHRLLDTKLFKKFSKNYEIMTWTVDDEKEFLHFVNSGISGLCSNRAEYFTSGKFIN